MAKPAGQSGKAEASKPEASKPEASKSDANATGREHKPGENKAGEMPAHPGETAKGHGTTSPAANLPKEHAPGATATTPLEPATPRASEHAAPKPATGSSVILGGRRSMLAVADEQRFRSIGQRPKRPARSRPALRVPGAAHARSRNAAPPQGGRSSAAPAATPHQPTPNAQRPNADCAGRIRRANP
jgi:hypothetical protein